MTISDYRGNPIRTLVSGQGGKSVAVLYPGRNYTLMAPVFFYLREALENRGFDILGIEHRFGENEEFLSSPDAVQDAWFDHDCEATGRAAAEHVRPYGRVVYVGKSLGTTMLMKQAKLGLVPKEAELVWLTPGTYFTEIMEVIPRLENRSLVVYGTADTWVRREAVEPLRGKSSVRISEIENAGHVFEEEHDIERSVMNIVKVIREIEAFLD